MDKQELQLILKNHLLWLDSSGGEGANLQGANLDFSCLPLWCGSKDMKVDKRLACQIAAHFCALDCDGSEYKSMRESLLPFAKQSHRASELGI